MYKNVAVVKDSQVIFEQTNSHANLRGKENSIILVLVVIGKKNMLTFKVNVILVLKI